MTLEITEEINAKLKRAELHQKIASNLISQICIDIRKKEEKRKK